MAIPPNLDPAIAKQVIEYLKANPEAAQRSYEEANRLLQTPGMAQMMLDAKVEFCDLFSLTSSTLQQATRAPQYAQLAMLLLLAWYNTFLEQ